MNRKFLCLSPLLLLAAGCSASTCIAFCTNQTKLQHEYEASRDVCRELAELKMQMLPSEYATLQRGQIPPSLAMKSESEKSRLVNLFSKCMNTQGWLVPGPNSDKKPKPDDTPVSDIGSPIAPTPLAIPEPENDYTRQVNLQRSADCAFARQAADSSMISRKRAQACDLECAEARRRAPDTPDHPSCP